LTFISVGFYDALLPTPVNELDGVYWTLYVEAGFYLIIGLLYFPLGWRRSLIALAGLWLSVLIVANLMSPAGPRTPVGWLAPLQWLGAEYFGWFVSGGLFLKAREQKSDLLFGLAILVGVVSAL